MERHLAQGKSGTGTNETLTSRKASREQARITAAETRNRANGYIATTNVP
jgi:hypothetical protein